MIAVRDSLRQFDQFGTRYEQYMRQRGAIELARLPKDGNREKARLRNR